MSFDYVTPSGTIRKVGVVAMDVDRFAAAMRAKDAARPAPAKPKREAVDGTPCFNCGASGYAGCAHQIAAARPKIANCEDISRPKSSRATPEECAAFLSELDWCVAHYSMSAKERDHNFGSGTKSLRLSIQRGWAMSSTVQKYREKIREFKELNQ